MPKFEIEMEGCDDTTKAAFNFNARQLDFVLNIMRILNDKAEHGCQPKMHVNGVKN